MTTTLPASYTSSLVQLPTHMHISKAFRATDRFSPFKVLRLFSLLRWLGVLDDEEHFPGTDEAELLSGEGFDCGRVFEEPPRFFAKLSIFES